ncbi:MAG: hypothetical protein N4A62_19660 [Marinisporobacter sp.]|jgi:hypothetical protein|nr:hypothetical protein [Marinisporobacter sp.]
MGRSKGEVSEVQKSIIISKIKENKNKQVIFEELKASEEFKKINDEFKYSDAFLYTYIRDTLNKRWDKKNKMWVNTEPKPSVNTAGTKQKESCPKPSTTSKNDTILENIHALNTLVKDTYNKIYELESKMDKITKFLIQIKKENPYDKNFSLSEEFLKIYCGKKKKLSISLNGEIIKRILEHMETHYDIDESTSSAIDAALILALNHYPELEDKKEEEEKTVSK